MASRSSRSELEENIKKGRDKVIQTYEMLPVYCQPEDIPGLVIELRNTMKNYVILESKVNDLSLTRKKVAQELAKRDNSLNPISLEEISELMKVTYTKESEKHPNCFWESDPMYASMKDFDSEPIAQQDEANDDEELAVTSETIQTTDPYTKQEFTDPLKNRVCGHTYERAVIMELLATNVHGQKCYWMGCKNRNVRKSDLEPDYELRRHIARMKAKPI